MKSIYFRIFLPPIFRETNYLYRGNYQEILRSNDIKKIFPPNHHRSPKIRRSVRITFALLLYTHTHTRFIPSKRTHVRNETELARLPCNKPRASLPRLALCIDPGECQERAMVRSRRVAHDPGCTFRATLARCGKLRSHLRSPAMPANDLGLARMGRSLGCRSMQPCNSR